MRKGAKCNHVQHTSIIVSPRTRCARRGHVLATRMVPHMSIATVAFRRIRVFVSRMSSSLKRSCFGAAGGPGPAPTIMSACPLSPRACTIVGAHFNAPVWSRRLRGLTEVSPYDLVPRRSRPAVPGGASFVGAHFNAPVSSRSLRGLTEVGPYDYTRMPTLVLRAWPPAGSLRRATTVSSLSVRATIKNGRALAETRPWLFLCSCQRQPEMKPTMFQTRMAATRTGAMYLIMTTQPFSTLNLLDS